MAPVGVEITTSVRPGTSNTGVTSGRFHIAGLTEKGPSDGARVVRSRAQFESIYGVRTPYSSAVYDTARMYWEEGGDELIMSRAVGAGATKGSLSLLDSAGVATLKVSALDAGAHSTGTTVEVLAGTAGTFSIKVRSNGVLVGNFLNLATPAAAVEAAGASEYVTVSDLGATTAAPGNNPVVLAATPLSAGTDDRGSVTTATMIAALESAGRELDGAAVAVPGYSVDVIGEDLLAHAAEYKKVALMSFDAATTLEEAVATAPVTDRVNGSYGAVIFPHVVVPDGNGTRTVSPEGYAAAARARAHASTGFWQAPPGDRSLARWIVGTSVPLDIVNIEALDENNINGILTMANRPRLYGWSSLSEDRDAFALLSTRDTLNNVGARLRRELEEFVFTTIDGKGHLLSKVESAATGVLANVASAGGFYPRYANGERVDPGYSVTVDETLNTSSSLANNEVRVGIGVRLSPMAKSIFVEIIKVPLNASV